MIARFDREALAHGRRARARAAEPRRALLPVRDPQRADPRRRARDGQGESSTSCSAAGAATRRRRPRPARAGRGGDRARARARLGRRGSATGSCSGAATRCASSASRSSPTTSPSRSRSRRASTTLAVGAPGLPANLALLWLNDPGRADVTLTQARATSFGVGNLQFVTRAGIQVLLGQAAGIVISLLVAFSLVALVAAGTMLAAGAAADVAAAAAGARRPARARVHAGAARGRPGARGRARRRCRRRRSAWRPGALAVAGPSANLLAQLNEQPPGLGARCRCSPPACSRSSASSPPRRPGRPGAPRAARRPRSCARGSARTVPARFAGSLTVELEGERSLLGLGARFATAARGRYAAAVATIAVCAGVVTLMLALAALLERLRDDPGSVGKRYELTARLEPVHGRRRSPRSRAWRPRGVRYQVDVADSFRLGEPLRLIAYPGDHTRFEAPPLAAGRRLRGPGEAEVGQGLADALGLRPGATLAVGLRGRRRGALPRGRRRAGAGARRARRVRPPRPAPGRRPRPGRRVDRDPAAPGRRPRGRGAAADGLRRAAAAGGAAPRPATPPSSACSPPSCAASGWPSGSSASTRSCRRWP